MVIGVYTRSEIATLAFGIVLNSIVFFTNWYVDSIRNLLNGETLYNVKFIK